MKALFFAMQMLPAIVCAVKGVESAIGSGNGQTKKDLIMSALHTAADTAEKVPEEHVQLVGKVIDSVVATLNGAGILPKPPAAAEVPIK